MAYDINFRYRPNKKQPKHFETVHFQNLETSPFMFYLYLLGCSVCNQQEDELGHWLPVSMVQNTLVIIVEPNSNYAELNRKQHPES